LHLIILNDRFPFDWQSHSLRSIAVKQLYGIVVADHNSLLDGKSLSLQKKYSFFTDSSY
jgi:hypothetical protein